MSPTLAAAWLVAKVSNSPALAGLAGRVYPDAAPEGAPNPCLIYQLLDHEEDEQLDAGEIRDSSPGFQLRIYAATRMEANALREAAKALLQNIAAGQVTSPAGTFMLQGTAFGDLADTYDTESKDYGALAVVTIHGGSAA